ncbi:hypothetical protein [Desulfobacula phenolica]|uniref:Prophage minor tail protein Z (GPZ) n=1 Tax=Desulfobacula phenolica TaxID=90732 RepID=A0A1H2I365_9BACT|nr:hypothetical protein [Desulfobacula phenolica]SDU38336.1 hypothetical protein SAMN04487931_107196 [Desulfobacula phenolica]
MLEIHLDERGELAIENISALLKAFPQYAERATASALNSEGYRLKELIQAAIRRGGVDGEWDTLNPHTGVLSQVKAAIKKKPSYRLKNYKMVWKGEKGSKRRVKQYTQVKLSTRTQPLLRLAGAVRYKYDPDMQMVNIGFIRSGNISGSILRLARMHARGSKTPVTPDMRKMLFALGFPIKKTTTVLKTPARPVIEPVFEQEKDNIMGNIERKFIAAINRYLDL